MIKENISTSSQSKLSNILQNEISAGTEVELQVLDNIFAPLLFSGDTITVSVGYPEYDNQLAIATVNDEIILARVFGINTSEITVRNIITNVMTIYNESLAEQTNFMLLAKVKSVNFC